MKTVGLWLSAVLIAVSWIYNCTLTSNSGHFVAIIVFTVLNPYLPRCHHEIDDDEDHLDL